MTKPHSRLYSDLDALRWMLDVAKGLEHLHTRHNVVHRDLKLENILLIRSEVAAGDKKRSKSKDLLIAKISDLGLHQVCVLGWRREQEGRCECLDARESTALESSSSSSLAVVNPQPLGAISQTLNQSTKVSSERDMAVDGSRRRTSQLASASEEACASLTSASAANDCHCRW